MENGITLYKKKAKLYIGNMSCVNCQHKIEKTLSNTEGIHKIEVSYRKGTADILYDETVIKLNEIEDIIEKLGYTIHSETDRQDTDIVNVICTIIIILSLYMILQCTGILNMLVPGQLADSKMGYGMLFVIGLLTSVHCIAMCGGINLSQSLSGMAQEVNKKSARRSLWPALTYNLGRVCSYTVVGFIMGLIGFLFGKGTGIGIPGFAQGIMKLAAGILMIIMGIDMLKLFPWIRQFTIPMPGFLTKITERRRRKAFRPFGIGILNGFMPCGPLQTMWIVALATGNPLEGSLSMLLFSLGTVPLMLGLGTVVSVLGKRFTNKIMTIGAILVVTLGLAMVSQGNALLGWHFGLQDDRIDSAVDTAQIIDGIQMINSTLASGQYPDILVQTGMPVRWVINAPEGSINGCNYKILIRDFDIEYTFHTGENVIEFTPEQAGRIQYSCWMGMIYGNIVVTE